MKKTRLISLSIITIAVVICIAYGFSYVGSNNTPSYVRDAQERVSSYLSYSYGPATCITTQKEADIWSLECQLAAGNTGFKYTVHPAEKSPDGTARSFYIMAVNAEAKQSAKADLMVYLDINTDNS